MWVESRGGRVWGEGGKRARSRETEDEMYSVRTEVGLSLISLQQKVQEVLRSQKKHN